MRGRKPQDGAIRRKLSDAYGLAEPEERAGVEMPADIAANPVQSEIWALLAPPVNSFTEQDVPILRQLVYWHAVAQQARQAMQSESGMIRILEPVGYTPFKTKDGRDVPLMRRNPALQVMKEASAEIRALSDMLGLSPLARSRIGLMDAATAKTAADTAALFKSIDAAYELPDAVEVVVEDAQD